MNFTKKTFIFIIVLIIAVVLVVIATRDNTQAPASPDHLTIGALAPLTGHLSVLGERMRNGMELARQQVLADGQLESFEIVYEDACDTTQTLNAVRKFMHQEIHIIGSGFCLFGMDAVVPIVEQEQLILFNTAANPESVLGRDFIFSTNFAIRDDAHKMAAYAVDELAAKRVGIIYLDSSFGESYRINLDEGLEALGSSIVFAEASLPSDTDFRTTLAKARSADVDLLVIIHFGKGMGSAIKQARELGLNMPLMGDYEAEDPTVLEFAGAAAEGLIISSSQPAQRTPEVIRFEQKYFETYGEMPDVLATNAYDAITLQATAFVQCGHDTVCMAASLEQTDAYAGVSGTISIDPNDHSTQKNTVFKVVKDGEFVVLGSEALEISS